MPSPVKIHLHNTVLFITLSLEQGILLIPNRLLDALLQSALARAQELHPMTVSHFAVEGTHVHLIVVVYNPDDIKGFVERFKTESAHYINRLLGRKKRTIWCEGYDSPVLLTVEDTVRRIVYTYTNPAKDGLEESIESYPGLSSWKMYTTGSYQQQWQWIHRPMVPCIKGKHMSPQDYNALAGELLAKSRETFTFKIDPNAWMDCFGIADLQERAELNARIRSEVAEEEEYYRQERQKAGKGVIGQARLLRQQLNTDYLPERDGRRMLCISCDRDLRKRFILWVKELVSQARDVLSRWRVGDFSEPFPPGLYPPSMPKLAELLPIW